MIPVFLHSEADFPQEQFLKGRIAAVSRAMAHMMMQMMGMMENMQSRRCVPW